MRTVIVASPAANKAKKIENFTGRTWGELKSHATVRELMVGSVEAIVNPGNHSLTREDAQLPEGDFKLYLVPTKNKAGAMSAAQATAISSEIAAAIVTASAKAEEAEFTQLKAALVASVEAFYEVSVTPETAESAALNEASAL